MAILTITIFGAALALSVWTMFATIRPQFARIVDLLVNGPVAMPMLVAPVPARSNLRDVSMRRLSTPMPLRAAA